MTERLPASVGDLLLLTTDGARLQHLEDEGLADVKGLDWVLDRAQELVHDNPEAASQLAQLCDASAQGLGIASASARACYLLARVHAERGQPDRALELIGRARDVWWGAGQHLQSLRTDLGRMQILDDLGRHSDALAVGTDLITALDSLTVTNDEEELRQWTRAAALENVGVAYGFVGEHERALSAYAMAERSYLDLGMAEETARPRANRGVELLELGRGREALSVLQSAEAMFADAGDRLWSAKCLGHVAQALEQVGELRAALEVLEPARVTLDELGAETEAARIRLAIARVYLGVGLAEEACIEAAAALETSLASGLAHDAATARFLIAQAHADSGNLDEAGRAVRAAASMFAQVGDAQGQARAKLAEADIAAAQHHHGEAVRLAAEAAEALEAGGWLIPLTWAELRLCDSADDTATAAAHLARATALASQLGLPQLRYACDVRTARDHRHAGHEVLAERLLRAAIADAERVGASLPTYETRRAFRAGRLAADEELTELLLQRATRPAVAEALRVADRSKNRTLEDLRTRTVGAPRRLRTPAPGSTPDLDSQLDQLRIDLNAVYGALISTDSSRAPALRLRASDLERQINTLRARAPLSAAPVAPPQPAAPDAEENSHCVGLEFHVSGNDVLAFVTRGGRVEVQRLTGALQPVEVQLDRLAAQWSRFRMGAAFVGRHQIALLETCRQILGSLYRMLIEPVAELIADGVDHLVVVPHRRLHQVPFHALYDGSDYLIDRWTITVSPSLAGQETRAASLDQGTVVLAVPDARARSVSHEAETLAGLLPHTRVFLGSEATSDALMTSVPGPGALHIACHGLYRAANALFSSLRLADRWVAAAEILDLELDGALVTLSACESGRYGTGTAEPVGLGWAFLAAGASGVVVSQWAVDDDVTATLMGHLYGHLVGGSHPADALRQAQLATARHHPHPFYWAPFAYVASARDLIGAAS
ncbi:MAG TPA: CHAT domain-containing protein [Propionibacteriaceae bacterium]|nr:CHAT domain-containing protein [Propionibacteriaceae bacterium]